MNCAFNQETISALFIAPIQKFTLHYNNKNKKPQPVYSIDVADNGLGVSASADGSLLVWLTQTGEIRVYIMNLDNLTLLSDLVSSLKRVLEGHISDINICRFFPSGIVVLSGGSDLRIKGKFLKFI